MHPRAQALVSTLQLLPHPEGGWYREEFRSTEPVSPADARGPRSALTAIYFLLEAGQHSRWHRVQSDEVWVHLEGAVLDLWTWDAERNTTSWRALGPVAARAGDDTRPQYTVPAGQWQAAAPQPTGAGGYTLAACMVGPGFDFEDFRLMKAQGPEAQTIRRDHAALAVFI